MVRQVVLTEQEYQELLDKANKPDNNDIEWLKACEYTLESHMDVKGLCPICRKAVLVSGYICPSCNYDSSYSVQEWKELKNK